LIFSPIAPAVELHVGPGQTYATISDAVAAAGPDDTIIVHDNGTTPDYREAIVIDVAGLTLQPAAGEDVVIQSVDYWGDVIVVTANGVTIQGLDIFGTDDGYNYTATTGIHVDGADNCILQDNRCGWSPAYRLRWGVYLSGEANNNLVSGNVCSYNEEEGIYLHGSDFNLITGNVCSYSEDYYHTESGIRLYASVRNSLMDNTCEGSPRGMDIVTNSNYNTIANNVCSNNLYDGIYMYGNMYCVLTENTAQGNDIGIHMLPCSHSILAANTLSGNSEYGLYIYGNYSHCYLNEISGNGTQNVYYDASGTDNVWRPRTKLSYFVGGPARKGYLGNYYGDYAGVDGDGDGIGDTPYVGVGFTDDYPLVMARDEYVLRTWFLNDPDMIGNDLTQEAGDRVILPGGTLVWVADQPATSDMTFLAGAVGDETCWTYQLAVSEAYQQPQNYLTLTMGYANGDGSDFTSVGGQPSTYPAATATNYLAGAFDNAQEFTVPTGQYLALEITNAHGSYSYTLYGGGAWSYVSASFPSPAYPVIGGETSAVSEGPGGPHSFEMLRSAWPNPFTRDVQLYYDLPVAMPMTVTIYDVTGRLVRTLFAGPRPAGRAAVIWDGQDGAGRPVASGVYFCRLDGMEAGPVIKVARTR
jgi:parallel beta-helix repeat protein